jgi:GTP cyclohydrolase I
MGSDELVSAISEIIEVLEVPLESVGPDFTERTPARVADMFSHVFAGMRIDPQVALSRKIPYQHENKQSVMVRGLQFYSMCEHHFLPFFGTIDLAYIPDEHIVGLGHILELVKILSKRPQLQERLANNIADELWKGISPRGVALHISARHLCSLMVTNEHEDFRLDTVVWKGLFEEQSVHQENFYQQISDR